MSENSFDDIISKISSSPELLNQIASSVKNNENDMSKALSGVIDIISKSNAINSEKNEDLKKESGAEPTLFLDTSGAKKEKTTDEASTQNLLFSMCQSISKNSSLLLALKPYLNRERQDLIENILKISKLASIASIVK